MAEHSTDPARAATEWRIEESRGWTEVWRGSQFIAAANATEADLAAALRRLVRDAALGAWVRGNTVNDYIWTEGFVSDGQAGRVQARDNMDRYRAAALSAGEL